MKIVYIAKHDSGHNDDEGAIAHAFRSLGHEVICVPEDQGRRAALHTGVDLWLAHKWNDQSGINRINTIKNRSGGVLAFWYFDLVLFDPQDTSLNSR